MPAVGARVTALLGTAVLTLVLAACGNEPTGPSPAALELRLTDPVVARFVEPSGVFVAEFTVTVVDASPRGGTVQHLDTTVFNRSRSLVVATNRRPNDNYAFPDSGLPARGELTLEAGIGFAPPPPRDELVVTVRVQLTDGRATERTAALQPQF